ncbi:mitogen-activated protein kinase 15 isoform X2 [Pristis pectinata]|uniref:mitogen-activated protein kinase 15 isoform X2 n=1 Tax=Pristis pectinata TaxID=685728 RepID=UPI00223E89B8|nr:mitogen-activated protein kinase 15 isoform X2 [Pristis pectinata]
MSAAEVDERISRKYQLKRRLGKGAYGIVWKAIDRQTGEVVAVKKIFDAFRNQTDAQRTFREILFLQEFGNHGNVIKLLNVIRAANDRDIYLVFEFMETDLHAVIRKGNLLKDIHIRYILYQLLKATKFIHSGNVIHRDQKPSNILLDADCFVKLCDFGLARCINQIQEEQGNPALTEYVATRWYRAPEILLASPRYTKGVDMWSVGCILGEMLLGKPLFPGTSSINQIERIMSVIPAPSNEDVQSINSDYGASVVQKILTRPRTSIDQLLPSTTPSDALDLLNKLLVFNPDHRLTAEQALGHPYLSRFHNPSKEPKLDYDIVLPVDDDTQLSVAEYRNKLYQMILERKTNARLQRQLMKEPEPLKSPPGSEPKEVTSASSRTPAVPDTRGSAHEEKVFTHPTTNVTSYNPITHSPLTYAAAPKPKATITKPREPSCEEDVPDDVKRGGGGESESCLGQLLADLWSHQSNRPGESAQPPQGKQALDTELEQGQETVGQEELGIRWTIQDKTGTGAGGQEDQHRMDSAGQIHSTHRTGGQC